MKKFPFYIFLSMFGLFSVLLIGVSYYHIRNSIWYGDFFAAKIVLEPNSMDLGDVSSAENIQLEVVVKNQGWRSLTLERVRPSCSSCLSVQSFPQEPIFPGKTGTIVLTMDTSQKNGATNTTFAVYSNDLSRPAVVFNVSANIVAGMEPM